MKYLLYYKLDSKFVTDQTNAGGDGTKVVSVVDGVAWTNDAEKAYYRLNGEDSAITSYTITVYYRYISGSSYTSVTQENIYTINCYSGYSAEVTLFPKQISGYIPKNESTALTVSGNMTYVFEYYKESEISILTKYTTTTTEETVRLYFSESFGNSLLRIVIDDIPFGQLSIQSAFTFNRAGEHTVVYYLKDIPTSLPEATFMGCSNLSEIDIPKTVTSIGAASFKDCSSLKSLVIPEGVTSLPGRWVSWVGTYEPHSGMCDGCSSLTEVILPSTLTDIGYCCFTDCSSLAKIKLPDGLTTIGAAAFRNCSSLTEITIPSGVASIDGVIRSAGFDYGVFAGCRNLVKIVSLASVAPTIYSTYYGTFYRVHTNGTLYYPEGSDYSAWLSSESQKYRLGYYGWSGSPITLLEKEYVEVASAVTSEPCIVTNDSIGNKNFKLCASFYLPVPKGTLIYGDVISESLAFYNNTIKIYSIRKSGTKRIIEHDTLQNSLNSGVNIFYAVYSQNSQGYGSYILTTNNVNVPINNYPYENFENYSSDTMYRLYQNYTDTGEFTDTAITIFNENISAGARFYGMKLYNLTTNELLYDYVPAYKLGIGYGVLEKVNNNFYLGNNLIGG